MNKLRLIGAILFLFSSCAILKPDADQPSLEKTHWKLVAMDRKPTDVGENVYMEFDNGKVKGKAGCNTFSTEYALQGKRFAFESVKSTKMFCDGLMAVESAFLTDLPKVRKFEIRYGMLYLYDSDNLLLTFKK